MTLQFALAVTLLLGLPLMLLAIGVLAHAYLLARPRGSAMPNELVEAMVAESVEQLLAQLRSAPSRLERATAEVAAPHATAPPAVAGASSMWTPPPAAAAPPNVPLSTAIAPSGANLVRAVAQLASEGLSDRSIARRLSVGIEEVRIARAPQHVAARLGGGR